MTAYIRIWQNCDVEEMVKHLLILGDITADCANCRELGIAYATVKICPKCGADFRFITLRNFGKLDKGHGPAVRRVKERRPDLTVVDYNDYKELTGRQQARDFFK